MPKIGFNQWVKRTAGNANRFFAKTGGHLRAGIGFLHNQVLPAARSAQKKLTDVSNILQQDANVSEKNRERLRNLNRLSDIGLTKLSNVNDTVQRVAAVV